MMAAGTHSLLIFLKRKAGISRADFRRHYEEHHVPLCMPYMRGPTRYVRRFVEPAAGGNEPDFDVVTELEFPSAAMRDATLAAMAADTMPADVVADEERFLDRAASRFCAVALCETALEQAA